MTGALQRITARVFASSSSAAAAAAGAGPGPGPGGNPVTIFQTTKPLCSTVQSKLAQGCDWESVVISPGNVCTFFMPSGEEVSFCAHAAMGAVRVLSSCGSVEFITASDGTPQLARVGKNNDVGLYMDSVYEEAVVDASSLLSQCGIKFLDTVPVPIVNASVARSKTLVKLTSVEALHKVPPPTDPDAFRIACDDIQSTGLYLYAESSPGVFECRQFPRASGYPEDPATGIAAGALAVHLHPTLQLRKYDFFQGTAMGRPSLIQIRNLEMRNDSNSKVKLECWGRVEIDFSDELII